MEVVADVDLTEITLFWNLAHSGNTNFLSVWRHCSHVYSIGWLDERALDGADRRYRGKKGIDGNALREKKKGIAKCISFRYLL